MSSGLWNAVETTISAWARDLEESLETNTEPDWNELQGDMAALMSLVNTLAARQGQAEHDRFTEQQHE